MLDSIMHKALKCTNFPDILQEMVINEWGNHHSKYDLISLAYTITTTSLINTLRQNYFQSNFLNENVNIVTQMS